MKGEQLMPGHHVRRVVIIGGGASGISLASSLQRSRRDIEATLITRQMPAENLLLVGDSAVAVLEGECESLSETPDGVAITLTDGTVHSGDIAVLVTGCDSFRLPEEGHVTNARALPPELVRNSSVFILGTGPLAVDYVLRLVAGGHNGPIYLLSHHGRMPFTGESGDIFKVDLADIPIGTSLAYLVRWMRCLIRWCGERGYDWRSVVDGLKPHAGVIWQHLSTNNRKRFLAHARAWWEAHAYRLTPGATAAIRNALGSGQLTVFAGRLASVDKEGADITVTFRPRGRDGVQRLAARHIVNCDDIPEDLVTSPSPMIRHLLDAGLARPDPLELGLDVSRDCAIIRADGTPSRRLYAVGPPTRGAFFDAMELSRIGMQSEVVIGKLLNGDAARDLPL
jgi:uncharacterized NAD(P)/FAD-binding protein YdhS